MCSLKVLSNGAIQKTPRKTRKLLAKKKTKICEIFYHIFWVVFRQAAYDRMLGQLAQCEFTVRKSAFSRKMMQDELANYKDISKAIDGGIEQAKIQIAQSKENLVVAKKIRKNRMEYDVLAKVISQQPDRKETLAKLESLKKDLDNLKSSRTKLDQKLEYRRNDFTVLMRSIQQLQKKLDGEDVTNEDTNENDKNNGDDDDIEVMSVDGEILDDSK